MLTAYPEQSSTGLTWITEFTLARFENFLRAPVGEYEYRNPSNEPIDIQPGIQSTVTE